MEALRAPQPSGETTASSTTNGSAQGAADRSVGALAKELFRESHALARAEAALVKSEINEKIADAKAGLAELVTGGATLAAGILVLLAAAVIAVDRVLELWLAALLVGGVVTLFGGVMLAAAKQKLRVENLTPNRTLDEVSRTRSFLKEQV